MLSSTIAVPGVPLELLEVVDDEMDGGGVVAVASVRREMLEGVKKLGAIRRRLAIVAGRSDMIEVVMMVGSSKVMGIVRRREARLRLWDLFLPDVDEHVHPSS